MYRFHIQWRSKQTLPGGKGPSGGGGGKGPSGGGGGKGPSGGGGGWGEGGGGESSHMKLTGVMVRNLEKKS